MDKDDSNWDADEDTGTPGESQSRGMSVHSSPMKETLMETLTEPPVELLCEDALPEATVGLGSQDVVQIHARKDDLD